MASLLPLAGVLVGMGCASAPEAPDYILAPDLHAAPACPEATHLASVASAPGPRDSAGPEAESLARAALVRKIRSRIEVEVDRLVEVKTADGGPRVDRQLRQATLERASFEHADLLDTVEIHEHEGKTFALVCLDRVKAADAVAHDDQEARETFTAASEQAASALEGGNARAFTTAYLLAQKHAPRPFRSLALTSALRGAPSADEEKLRERWAGLLRGAAEVRTTAEILLRFDGAGFEAVEGRVVERIRGALASTGVQVRLEDAAAGTGGPGGCAKPFVYKVAVTGEPRCAWGAAGHMCKPVFAARGLACGGSPRSLFDLQIEPGAGMHSRDQGRALEQALAGFSDDKLAPMIDVLAAELPQEADLAKGEGR